MAVIETKKEPRDIRSVLFVVALIVGFLALGGVIFWLVKPAAPRQVKLSGEQAKQAEASYVAPTPVLPAQAPIPQGTDPGPTMVTLDLEQVTPRQALMELAKQGKINLKAAGGNSQGFFASMMSERIDVSVKNEPLWSAMIDLCRKGKLMPYSDWNAPTQVSFRQVTSQEMGPAKAVGSCLVMLEDVTSRFDADLIGTRPHTRNLNVQMRLFVEPKLAPYRISSVATLEQAVDENGVNLIRPRGQWDDRNSSGPQSTWMKEVNAQLLFPDNAGGRIAKLKGYASVAVAGKEQTVTIDAPLTKKNVDTKIDGLLVRLIELRKNGNNNYNARMAGDSNSPVFKEYEKFSKILTLVDSNGKEFQRSGGGWGGGRAGTMEFSVNFSGPGDMSEPKELRVTLPTGIKEIRIPFEFTDLPLPH